MGKMSQHAKRQRHEFLLTFFDPSSDYDVREVNGYVLVKQFNKGSNNWEVAIYSKEGWRKVQQWKDSRSPCSEVSNTEQTVML